MISPVRCEALFNNLLRMLLHHSDCLISVLNAFRMNLHFFSFFFLRSLILKKLQARMAKRKFFKLHSVRITEFQQLQISIAFIISSKDCETKEFMEICVIFILIYKINFIYIFALANDR